MLNHCKIRKAYFCDGDKEHSTCKHFTPYSDGTVFRDWEANGYCDSPKARAAADKEAEENMSKRDRALVELAHKVEDLIKRLK